MQLLYFSFNPCTMGSILRQSIQVPAKNSIKIKSLCFGIIVRAGVSLATGETGVPAERTVEGTAVSAGLHENTARAATKESKQSLGNTRIFVNCIRTLERQHFRLLKIGPYLSARLNVINLTARPLIDQIHVRKFPDLLRGKIVLVFVRLEPDNIAGILKWPARISY